MEINPSLIEQVSNWKKQGYSDESITQYLKSQGFSDNDIYLIMNKVSMGGEKKQVPSSSPSPKPSYNNSMDEGDVETEELIEAIIDEKWQDLSKDIKVIIDWKVGVESTLARLDERIKAVESRIDSIEKAVISRVTEYDRHVQMLAGELKAIEKALGSAKKKK